MFDLTLGSKRTCDGVSRREVLRVGALWTLGLSLPGYLAIRASSGGAARRPRCLLHPALAPGRDQPHRQLRSQARGSRGDPRASSVRSRPACPGSRLCDPLPQLAQRPGQILDRPFAQPAERVARGRRRLHADRASVQPVGGLSLLWLGRLEGAGRPRVACRRTCRSARTSTSASGAASRGSWATSTTRSCCPATRRGRISRCATSNYPAASTGPGSSGG